MMYCLGILINPKNRIGTAGIGRATTLSLARLNPSHIYFTGRNVKQAQEVISAAKASSSKTSITFIECDFQSLKSVKTAMAAFKHSTLDVFIGNAGISMDSLSCRSLLWLTKL
jgi:NAD(P)-dependent dehydrogenase (short-subunit alcohol dehydrogenase family)